MPPGGDPPKKDKGPTKGPKSMTHALFCFLWSPPRRNLFFLQKTFFHSADVCFRFYSLYILYVFIYFIYFIYFVYFYIYIFAYIVYLYIWYILYIHIYIDSVQFDDSIRFGDPIEFDGSAQSDMFELGAAAHSTLRLPTTVAVVPTTVVVVL